MKKVRREWLLILKMVEERLSSDDFNRKERFKYCKISKSCNKLDIHKCMLCSAEKLVWFLYRL